MIKSAASSKAAGACPPPLSVCRVTLENRDAKSLVMQLLIIQSFLLIYTKAGTEKGAADATRCSMPLCVVGTYAQKATIRSNAPGACDR